MCLPRPSNVHIHKQSSEVYKCLHKNRIVSFSAVVQWWGLRIGMWVPSIAPAVCGNPQRHSNPLTTSCKLSFCGTCTWCGASFARSLQVSITISHAVDRPKPNSSAIVLSSVCSKPPKCNSYLCFDAYWLPESRYVGFLSRDGLSSVHMISRDIRRFSFHLANIE